MQSDGERSSKSHTANSMPATLRDMGDVSLSLPDYLILDTSVVYLLITPPTDEREATALSFLKRISQEASNGNILLLVPVVVLEECYFKIIQQGYESGGYKKWHTDGYKAHPELIASFIPALENLRQVLSALPAILIDPNDLLSSESLPDPLETLMLRNIQRFNLLPADSSILAEAERLGVNHLATLDKDWDRAEGFVVYRPLK